MMAIANIIKIVNENNSYGRGFIVLLDGGGIFEKPAVSNTGSNSRTHPSSNLKKTKCNIFFCCSINLMDNKHI
jgi:hypothetical protein